VSYDTQGRRVLHGHPSTWQQEVEQLRADVISHKVDNVQLRARISELEAALREISTYASSGTAWEPDSCGMCENALETASAALQKQEGGE
jgi:hypothetical protein